MSDLSLIGGLPWWAILVVAFSALFLLLYQWFQLRRRLTLSRTLILTGLRGVVYFFLVAFLLYPALVEKRVTKLRRSLVVLIDASRSMAFPASYGPLQPKSRIEIVKEKLLEGREPLLEKLAKRYDLRWYEFSTEVKPLAAASLPSVRAHGNATRVMNALQQAAREPGAAGILLFSDGIDNGERPTEESSPFPLPVLSVGVGDSEGFTDVRIAGLTAPEFAFRGREVQIAFTLHAHGFKGKTIPVFFNRGRNLIVTRSVSVDQDAFEQKVTFSHTPKEIGAQNFTLSIPAQPGEELTQNNKRDFTIDVRRDKIRVLTLSGAPSWNYRFLRMSLKQDPFVDLISFVFLRTPTDSVDVPDNQLSLIPFPTDEIFLEELKNFDVIIFDNFSYRSYFNILYLEKIRDFIRDGGGLAMIGGVRSFDSGGYRESPFNEVLPVQLDGRGRYQSGARMRTLLTDAGKVHPVTRLSPDLKANEEAWKKMPALTTLNQVGRPRGETLLLASTDGVSGGLPLLTVGKFGKGRTMALMSDDLWRWSFVAVGQRESPQNHLKLVRQGIRWLAQEPSLEQVQIVSMSGSKVPGEKLQFKIRVLKDDFTPAEHASVRLRVIGPEGEKIPVETIPEGDEYGADFIPTTEGAYRLEAEAELSGRPLGKDGKSFVVAFPNEEIDDGRPRFDLLKRVAEQSHGEFHPIAQWNETTLNEALKKLEKIHPSEVVERRQTPLWSQPWVFGFILLLLSGEWWLRRSWGAHLGRI